MDTLHHLNHADVQDIAIKDAPRHNSATGYGGKIPTRYMLKLNKRWHRVYMMQYGNSGSPYVLIGGVEHLLRSDTEHALEEAGRAPLNLSAKPASKPVGIPTDEAERKAAPTKATEAPHSKLVSKRGLSIKKGLLMPALVILLLIGGMGAAHATLPQGNGLGESVTHSFNEAAAWASWDAANASSLVTYPGAYRVQYEAHNTVGWTLTESNEISVTDGFGNYYLFTVHAQ